jgi:hypothetical protein
MIGDEKGLLTTKVFMQAGLTQRSINFSNSNQL